MEVYDLTSDRIAPELVDSNGNPCRIQKVETERDWGWVVHVTTGDTLYVGRDSSLGKELCNVL